MFSLYLVVDEYGYTMYNMNGYIIAMDEAHVIQYYIILVGISYAILSYISSVIVRIARTEPRPVVLRGLCIYIIFMF